MTNKLEQTTHKKMKSEKPKVKSEFKKTTAGEGTESSDIINISISREHNQYLKDVEACFKGLNVSIDASYERRAFGELPMQIIIFLGGAILGGVIYDLLCFPSAEMAQVNALG